jgi:hypothetical protein
MSQSGKALVGHAGWPRPGEGTRIRHSLDHTDRMKPSHIASCSDTINGFLVKSHQLSGFVVIAEHERAGSAWRRTHSTRYHALNDKNKELTLY